EGLLTPRTKTVYSPEAHGVPLEVGSSGVTINLGNQFGSLVPLLDAAQFTVELVSGVPSVSTKMTDSHGNMIAEIYRNEWKVRPGAWDRNYSDDALEVKDDRGVIVLQVKVLPDRIQIQGGWWAMFRGTPAQMFIYGSHEPAVIEWIINRQPPAINPMF